MSIAVGLAWAEDARRKSAAEIERLRLTDEERAAVAWAAAAASNCEHPAEATLRGLLERLSDRS